MRITLNIRGLVQQREVEALFQGVFEGTDSVLLHGREHEEYVSRVMAIEECPSISERILGLTLWERAVTS